MFGLPHQLKNTEKLTKTSKTSSEKLDADSSQGFFPSTHVLVFFHFAYPCQNNQFKILLSIYL